jgi:hypothetical protein
MGGLFDSDLIPVLFVIFMMINVFFDKKKRRQRRQQDENTQQMPPAATPEPAKGKDVAIDFERRLKKTTEMSKAQKQAASARQRIRRDGDKVLRDGTNVRRDSDISVHHEGEAAHDSTGRVHREQEAFNHDKGRVYYDPRGDYSYDEEKMNAAAAAFSARYAQKSAQEQKPRARLKHAALVNGVIMAEVLGKPKALNGGSENF